MEYLIISTLPREEKLGKEIIKELKEQLKNPEIIYSEEYDIHACVGCNFCWLKTPGICSIKDDYEKILIKYLQVDRVIFLTEAKLGFVSYKMKNMLDRILPLVTMHLKFQNGQMRHYARYKKKTDMGVLYIGDADQVYLSRWMARAMSNFHATSLGAYPVEKRKELYHALNCH